MRKLLRLLPLLALLPTGCDAPAPASACAAPAGAGTVHKATVSADETWTEAGSPHTIPNDISVRARLTLAPCALVRIDKRVIVSVDQAGAAIAAMGESTRPVTIEGAAGAGPWQKIRFLGGGTGSFAYTKISGGGDRGNSGEHLAAMLEVRGDQARPPADVLEVRHVVLAGSGSNGIYMSEGAKFSDASTDLTISSSASHPIHVWARSAGSIPQGRYDGNGADTFLLSSGPSDQGGVKESTTFHDRGVPYEVGTPDGALGGRLPVDDPSVPLLTLEPGVVMRFQKDGGLLQVSIFSGDGAAVGALSAVGTADKPIVFTSAAASPAAGDWLGVWFSRQPDPRTRLDHVRVEYAGSPKGMFTGSNSCSKEPWAAIRFAGYGAPAPGTVTNTEIKASGKNGVDRGWRANSLTDFLGDGNKFDVAACPQTYPKDKNGACPMTFPCP